MEYVEREPCLDAASIIDNMPRRNHVDDERCYKQKVGREPCPDADNVEREPCLDPALCRYIEREPCLDKHEMPISLG